MNQDTTATSEKKESKQVQIYPRYIPCIDCYGMGSNLRQVKQLERDPCITCQGRGFLFSLS
jgi:DnaJ-class molecular chaperone